VDSKYRWKSLNLQPIVLESLIEEMQDYLICPFCQSRKILINHKKVQDRLLKTSFGGNWNLSSNMYKDGKCNDCKKEFDLLKDLLKLPDYAKYTPLTQKKYAQRTWQNHMMQLRLP
jgi:DNA-directed RNA polymerase subunit RPC12/RpoP